MDISAWLRELGLERYEQAFRENKVGLDVLPKLTADDLREIGVITVGDRRRLLEAIADLAYKGKSAPLQAASDAADPSRKPSGAERRQLTVLFCDLVGSTELSARLDPEELREVLGAYQASVAEVVRRWDGHVANYMGDGVLAYFGWPRAHEDDAERAVRAGLELSGAVGRLPARAEAQLAARIGIATGRGVVGDEIGQDRADKHSVVGETPNLAARLQAVAAPGSVVISQATRRLVAGLFELDDLGPQRLKGFAEPLSAWRVLGEAAEQDRFEALRGARLTPLVGRDEELQLLLARWRRAKRGEGQVVLLSGEPGIGKSRLVRGLHERLVGEPYTPISHFCSPYHTNSTLYPVIGLLERAAGFAPEDTTQQRLDRLEALLARPTELVFEAVPLIATLLSVPTGERYPPLELSPQRHKQRTLEVLVDRLAGAAARQPVLVVYEDVHWVDPTTLELLDLVVERVERLPVLVLITSRPEFNPPWAGEPHVALLPLNRLGRCQDAAIVECITGGKPLPAEVLSEIVDRTDGIPLFVEELTKAVLESNSLRDAGDRFELAGPLPPLAIPTTLHDSLMARLDRLGPVKEVAQIGAVIGREFSHALLAAVAPLGEPEITSALDQLVSAELIFRRATPPDAAYSFKHALVQDVAYQSLLRSRRQQLHARIAQVLEERFPHTCDQTPEILAHHHTEAGLLDSAIGLWHAAGRRAIERSAFKEAAEHLLKGLELLSRRTSGPSTLEQELELRTSLGPALIVTRGFAAPEVGRSYERARELCALIGQHPLGFPALWGSWAFHTDRAQLSEANEIGHELLELARLGRDEELTLQAHHALETSLFWCGRLRDALEHMQLGLAIYDPHRHRGHAWKFAGHDPGVCCLAFKALALWLSGYADQAERHREEAISLACQLDQPGSLGHAQQLSCRLRVLRRDVAAVLDEAEGLVDLANRHGFPYALAIAYMARGWALGTAGDVEVGIAGLEEGLRIYRASGALLARSIHLAMFAEVLGGAGRRSEAMQLIDTAFEHIASSDERVYKAELLRLKGELISNDGAQARDEAEVCLRQALAVAREQKAKAWELRAATSVARLWFEQGERPKAYDLLAPIYAWFTEGFDTADRKDAKALLDDLA